MAGNQPIVDIWMLRGMARVCDWVYHEGVKAAYNNGDEYHCRGFLEKTSAPGVFGVLEREKTFDWYRWESKIKVMAYDYPFVHNIFKRFFKLQGEFQKNYLSVFLVVAFEFYRRGIKDYCESPESCDINQFMNKTLAIWTRAGIKKFSTEDFVDLAQVMCEDRMDLDEDKMDEWVDTRESKYHRFAKDDMCKRVLKPQFYRTFSDVIGHVLSRHNKLLKSNNYKPWRKRK